MSLNFRTFLATLAIGLACGSNADATPVSRSTIGRLLDEADALYAQAAAIVADTPTTNGGADALAAARGRTFHHDERTFQDEVSPLNPPPAGTASTVNDAIVRISQFDGFVYNAVTDALSCSAASAKGDLRIARELLQHARADYRGQLQADWTPDLDVPDQSRGCQ